MKQPRPLEKSQSASTPQPVDYLTREDVLDAMQAIPGYLDISVDDFMEMYRVAMLIARQRLA